MEFPVVEEWVSTDGRGCGSAGPGSRVPRGVERAGDKADHKTERGLVNVEAENYRTMSGKPARQIMASGGQGSEGLLIQPHALRAS